MTQDDIRRMAREAATEDGSVNRDDGKDVVLYAAKTTRFLERFAALVAAAERERLKQSIRHSLTIGPKTIQTRVYFGEEEVSIVKMPIEEVVAAEREACADICDQHASVEGIAQRCADAIRARSRHEQG